MRLDYLAAACLVLVATDGLAQSADSSFVEIDEDRWVTFYDVPSHRFTSIREAFVRRQFETASRHLAAASNHLLIESGRATAAVAARLGEVGEQMSSIAENLDDPEVTADTLDRLFGRSHWLLAQHYLALARESRDGNNNRMAGRYLIATSHHLERAVLWSNERVARDVVKTLDGLRDLAIRLQDPGKAASARAEKPVVRAEKLLVKLGQQIDRPVLIKLTD